MTDPFDYLLIQAAIGNQPGHETEYESDPLSVFKYSHIIRDTVLAVAYDY